MALACLKHTFLLTPSCVVWLQGQSLADDVEMEKTVNDPLRIWFEALNDEDPPLPDVAHLILSHMIYLAPKSFVKQADRIYLVHSDNLSVN